MTSSWSAEFLLDVALSAHHSCEVRTRAARRSRTVGIGAGAERCGPARDNPANVGYASSWSIRRDAKKQRHTRISP